MRACRRLNLSNQSSHSSRITAISFFRLSTSCRRAKICLILSKNMVESRVAGPRLNVSGAIERVGQRGPAAPPASPTLHFNEGRLKPEDLPNFQPTTPHYAPNTSTHTPLL